MRQRSWIVSTVLSAFILAGCGGGGSGGSGGGVSTATFIDSPVEGLEFETPTQSGITDGNGNFVYQEGESVSFHIGSLYIGSAKPKDGKVTPLDLLNTSNVSNEQVVRILQTLQTLDSDGDPSNGITIDPAVRQTLHTQARVDLSNQQTTDAQVLEAIGKTAYSVSRTEAQNNFNPSMSSNKDKGYNPTESVSTATDIGNKGNYTLVAWNDLGMHCVDGKDYSIFSILPPYNNLHAHLVRKDVTSGKNVTSGVTLTYEAVADTTGSINTTSVTKTNFWDWVLTLFGARPSDNRGLNLSDPTVSNPTPSLSPAAMNYNSKMGWWEAEGIPITPYDDAGNKNYYPMVKVVARDGGGTVLATTKVVLPVSDEMTCKGCHSSNGNYAAARPDAGWVNDPNPEKDWKKNILRFHDQEHPTAIADAGMGGKYTGGTLLATAQSGTPVLCAACHKSNALGTPQVGSIKPLTQALHSVHAQVKDPVNGTLLNDATNRDACYLCHPGSKTKCLRGAMGNAKKADGSNAIDCQSCHGSMSTVGSASREGWLDQPNCQQCHDKDGNGVFQRYTSVFSSGTTPRATRDTKFATNPNTPMSGKSLYRFSKGHGNLQCEACHGATHAEYPSSHANDNVQSIALQGHSGTIAECSACHTTAPTNFTGGPHGMHVTGQDAVRLHEDVAERGTEGCKTCHGADYRGTFLSATSMARTLRIEDGKTKVYTAKQKVGCYDCHNGPNPD